MAKEKEKKQTKKEEKVEKRKYKPLPVEKPKEEIKEEDGKEKQIKDKEERLEDKIEKEKEQISKPAVEQAKETEAGKRSKEKKPEAKSVLEREYIIPLRKKVWKVQRYKRGKKAIRVIKEFLARHMKVEDRDLNKVKIDKWLNQEIWFRGVKKPPAKIKVKAVKMDNGIVRVELVDIPEKVKWDMKKKEKKKQIGERIKKVKSKEKKEEKPIEKESEEEKKDEEEKEKASVEAGLAAQKQQAKEMRHTAKGAHVQTKAPVRKSLKK